MNDENRQRFEMLQEMINKNFDSKQKEVFKSCIFYVDTLCEYRRDTCQDNLMRKFSHLESKLDKIISIIGNGNDNV